MKTSLICLLPLILSFPMEGESQFINIGTNRFVLSFDEFPLTEPQRRAIVEDLQHEYNTLTNLPVVLHDSCGEGYVDFTAYGCAPYEDEVRLPFTYSIDAMSGTRCFHVEASLLTRYKEALLLQASHTNAFQAAIPFIESLQLGLLHNMTSNEVSQIFYCEGATSEMYTKSRDDLSAYLDQRIVLEPGLLCFCLSDQYLTGHDEVLVMFVPYIDQKENGRHDGTTAIWIEGRWKLLLWRP